jgi:hypothetical protein
MHLLIYSMNSDSYAFINVRLLIFLNLIAEYFDFGY